MARANSELDKTWGQGQPGATVRSKVEPLFFHVEHPAGSIRLLNLNRFFERSGPEDRMLPPISLNRSAAVEYCAFKN
jgi:hypothetical protein